MTDTDRIREALTYANLGWLDQDEVKRRWNEIDESLDNLDALVARLEAAEAVAAPHLLAVVIQAFDYTMEPGADWRWDELCTACEAITDEQITQIRAAWELSQETGQP